MLLNTLGCFMTDTAQPKYALVSYSPLEAPRHNEASIEYISFLLSIYR